MKNDQLIIAIAGGSGSGKTTFAKKIIHQFQDELPLSLKTILHMDSYYLPDSSIKNFDHPKAFDWKLLYEHLSLLKKGRRIEVPVYDMKTSSRTLETITFFPTPIIIFEGIFSLYEKKIRDLIDLKIFINVDADIRFTRRLHRDTEERNRSVDSIIEQYYKTVRPMYQKHLFPQIQHADVIVGEENDKASEVIASYLYHFLSRKR